MFEDESRSSQWDELPPPPVPQPPRRKKSRWMWWVAGLTGLTLGIMGVSLALAWVGMTMGGGGLSSGSTLSIDTARSYPEWPLYELGGLFGASNAASFGDLLHGIDRAGADDRVENLLLRVRGTNLGWAHAVELRRHLQSFKESGKPLIAFIEFASNMDYVLASVADEVYMHPQTQLDLRGVRAEVTFLRDSLTKLGIEAEFERVGRYKNGPDGYTRSDMSEAQKESLGALIETIGNTVVSSIAESRGVEPERIESLMARGPLDAKTALAEGLVDGLQYLDEVETAMSATDYVEVHRLRGGSGFSFGTRDKIAVIYGIGTIVPGDSRDDLFSGRLMGSDTLMRAFRSARRDEDVKAVVFRIDSPGGVDVSSDVIWREAELTRAEKPVVVSMGNLAASGGYWVATASDYIVAEPTTITGSIGVYAGKFNYAGLYDWLGVNKEAVETSASASFYSDRRSFTPEERERLQRLIRQAYDRFLERVSTARDSTPEEVHTVAQGRVWSGKMALEKNLIDELGGLDRALEIAADRAGVSLEEADVVAYPRQKSFLETVLGDVQTSTRSPVMPALANPAKWLEGSSFLRHLGSGERLAHLPFELTIH